MAAPATCKVALVVGLAILYLLAWGLPLLVPDGLEGWTGPDRDAISRARELAYDTLWENELERLWIRQTRVVSVVIGDEPAGDFPEIGPGWEVKVKAYALFGLPYSQITMSHRSGSVNYRLPTGFFALLLVFLAPIGVVVWWPYNGDPRRLPLPRP